MYSKILDEYDFDVTKIRSLSIIDEDNRIEYEQEQVNISDSIIRNEATNKLDKGGIAYQLIMQEMGKDIRKYNIQDTKNMTGSEMADLLFDGNNGDYDDEEETSDVQLGNHTEKDIEIDRDQKISENKQKRFERFKTKEKNKTVERIKDAFEDSDISTKHIDDLLGL